MLHLSPSPDSQPAIASHAKPSPVTERYLLTPDEAARALGFSRRKLENVRRDPRFPTFPQPIYVGARHVLYRAAELAKWVESFPSTPLLDEPKQFATARAPAKAKRARAQEDSAGVTIHRIAEREEICPPRRSTHPSNPREAAQQ